MTPRGGTKQKQKKEREIQKFSWRIENLSVFSNLRPEELFRPTPSNSEHLSPVVPAPPVRGQHVVSGSVCYYICTGVTRHDTHSPSTDTLLTLHSHTLTLLTLHPQTACSQHTLRVDAGCGSLGSTLFIRGLVRRKKWVFGLCGAIQGWGSSPKFSIINFKTDIRIVYLLYIRFISISRDAHYIRNGINPRIVGNIYKNIMNNVSKCDGSPKLLFTLISSGDHGNVPLPWKLYTIPCIVFWIYSFCCLWVLRADINPADTNRLDSSWRVRFVGE